MRHGITDRGLLRFVFTILIFVSAALSVMPSHVRADLAEEPCKKSITNFIRIAKSSPGVISNSLAAEILATANGTRRIVGQVAISLPKGHEATIALGEQVHLGSKTYAVVHRGIRKVDATSNEAVNSTGLNSAIAVVENGKLKSIHLERGARVESAAEMIEKEKDLRERTGFTAEKIAEHVSDFISAHFTNGDLDLPGITSMSKSKLPTLNLLRISKIDKDTWIVRLKTAVDFSVTGQVSRPGDPGRMTVGLTAIINRDGQIAIVSDHSRQQLQTQGLKMSSVLSGGMPVQDLARAQERLGFHIAAVHDKVDGLQTGDFQAYSPADYRVTVAFEKDLPIKKTKEVVRKTETVFVEGTYSSRWGLVMPTDLPRINHLRRPDAPRRNILDVKREQEEKAAARQAERAVQKKRREASERNGRT